MAMQGEYVYVGASHGGMHIVDMSDPTTPALVGTFEVDYYTVGIAVSGNYVYMAHSNHDLFIIDVSNPSIPTLAGNYEGTMLPRQFEIVGDYLYMAAYLDGLMILNISTPDSPYLVGQYRTSPGWSWDVDIVGENIYVTADNGFLALKQSGCDGPNGSDGYNVADVVYLIAYIFKGGAPPVSEQAGDINCDGSIDLGDAVYLIDFIFRGGAAPCGGCH
jgi:hypothetical protein